MKKKIRSFKEGKTPVFKPLQKTVLLLLLCCWLPQTFYAQDFNEVIKAVASDRAAYDYFGYSVSISGDYAIVGARYEDEDVAGLNTMSYAGSAYIFERDALGNWNEVQKLTASDRATYDEFGYSVAISGDYAIVGAYREDEDAVGMNTMSYAGSAYMFERDASGNWSEVQKLTASDRAGDDYFGYSVAISGDYALVGAYYEDEDANGLNTMYDSGSAYVFERDASGNWSEVQKLTASDRSFQDFFGYSVSISGDYALIGAYWEDEDAVGQNTMSLAGSAYVFERDGSGNWNEVQKLIASDRFTYDYFGGSVAISGDYALVGAYGEDVNGPNPMTYSGSAYMFERDASGNWGEVQKLTASDRAAYDYFGRSVAISEDYAVVGAGEEDHDAGGQNYMSNSGSAYIFERDTSGNWGEVQKLTASDRADIDHFGHSVAISGDYVLVGALQEDEDAAGLNYMSNAGSAYIYERGTDYVYENGTWSPEDPALSATATDDIRIMNGNVTFSGPIACKDLSIDAGATLNVPSTLNLNGNLTNNGELVFTSTATANGELAAVPSTSSISGEVTVERYMSAQRSYRMVSSAVTTTSSIHDNWQEGATSYTDDPASGYGIHITGTSVDQQDGLDYTPSGNPSMFTLDVAGQQFTAIGNTDVNSLTAGKPYLLFVRGDRSTDVTINIPTPTETILRSTGSLATGDQAQGFTVSNPGDFVMFGNPYQASVDVFSVLGSSTNVNTSQYYVYDPTLADHGSYVTVLSDGSNNVTGSEANEYLQPGQAAQVASDVSGSVSILFQESDKAVGEHTATHRSANVSAGAKIKAGFYKTEKYLNGGKAHDGFLLLFSENYTNTLNNEDAVKPHNFNENMGISSQGKLLSIEKRSLPVQGESIQLFNNGYQYEDYTLVLQLEGMEGVTAYFHDNYTGEDTELSNGENILSLQVDTEDAQSTEEGRFSIFFTESSLSTGAADIFRLSLYPNPVEGDSFYIRSSYLSGENVRLEVTDVLGRTVYSSNEVFSGDTLRVHTGSSMNSGVYFVSVEHKGHRESRRIIKQ